MRFISLILLVFLITSCGGGGGGGGGGGSSPASSSTSAPVASVGEIRGDSAIWTSSSVTTSEADVYRTSEYENQWGLEAIHSAEAYALLDKNGRTFAGAGVLVAITDTGARVTHQDVADNMNASLNKNFVLNGSTSVNDIQGHGTHVMTTAVGVKNDTGMHGVAFHSTGFAVRIIEEDVGATAYGIEYAANNGAKVVNMSWGFKSSHGRTEVINNVESPCNGTTDCGGSFSGVLNKMLAGKDKDMLMVVATGNDADHRGDGYSTKADVGYKTDKNPGFPAIFANHGDLAGYVLAVGSLEKYGDGYRISDFSNNCGVTENYCLTAPGSDIFAGDNGSDTDYYIDSGTSMAAPHVTGAVAVIRGAWTFLTAPQVSEILLSTATDLGDVGVDEIYGRGMLNLYAAVQAQGANNFSFGTTVAASAYDLRTSSMTTSPIFGDSLQTNVVPQLSNAVFFDKYGRDYKADFSGKILSDSRSASPDLNNIILSNISYQNLPLEVGFSGKTKLNFNLSNYKNSDVKNQIGLKHALIDNSFDQQQQASSNNGFSFTQNDAIIPNSSFGFAFNIDEISNSQNKEFSGLGFLMQNNFAANPYQNFLQQNFGQDPRASRKFNQFFAQKTLLDKKIAVNFSYQSSHESQNLIGNSGVKQNQILDLGLSFKGKNDSNLLVSTGSLKEFDNNILNSKSVGAFSSGDGVSTSYVKLVGSKKLTKNLKLIASISEGISQINGNNRGIFREFNNVRSRSTSIAITHDNFFKGKIGASYIEPMRIYEGQVKFDIPIARDNAGNVTRYQGNASLVSQGKERDLEVFYLRQIDELANISFNFLMQKEPGNIKGAKDNHLGFVTYHKIF